MKTVYDLWFELLTVEGQEHVRLAQALTLDESRPLLGLKGTNGLFGSDEWWMNIRSGRIPTRVVEGVIHDMAFAGQDARWGDEVNELSLRLPDGSFLSESIYTNDTKDRALFKPGAEIRIVYALDELKRMSAGQGNAMSEIVLEMAIGRLSS